MLAGPVSFLLSSDAFVDTLEEVLGESIPDGAEGRARGLDQVRELMVILRRARRPTASAVPACST